MKMCAATMFRWGLVAVFLLCHETTWAAKKGEEELSPSEPAEAYLALVRGDTAREAGNDEAAIAAYEDALSRYERIASVHPDWESDIVQYRIGYCLQQIEAARARSGQAAPPDVTAEVGESSTAEEPRESAPPEAFVSEPTVKTPLSDQLGSAESEPAPGGATSQEVEYLRMRMAELLDQVEQLEAELEAQRGEGAPKSVEAELEEARRRAEKADAWIEQLENEVRRLSRALAERETPGVKEKEDAESDARYATSLQNALRRERERDFRGALALYEQLRKKTADDRYVTLGQARCLIGLAQVEKALGLLSKAEYLKDDEDALVLQAAGLGMLGRYDEAISLLKPRAQEGTGNAWIYNLLGAALLEQGRFDEARQALEKAVALDPNLGEAHYNLAVLIAAENARSGATNDMAQVRELYRKSVELGGLSEPDFEQWINP